MRLHPFAVALALAIASLVALAKGRTPQQFHWHPRSTRRREEGLVKRPPRTEGVASRECVASILALLVPLGGASAATFTVPGSSSTIQGAVNMAASGDIVLVSSGNYPEAINFLGKNITLRSVSGPSVTTITAPAMTPVVQFVNSEDRSAILDGFTLTGGRPAFVAPYFGDGGGIFASDASPTIINNVITGNVACRGGGIQVYGSPAISQNRISDNRADCTQLGFSGEFWGGGISLQGEGAAVITGNTFVGNTSGDGSAIGMNGAGTPSIVDNMMTGNTANGCSGWSGGTLWMVNDSSPDFVQNVIVANNAACNGGVVFLVPDGGRGPALVNNTIALNGGTISSGIYAEGFDTITRLVDNIVLAKPGSTAMYCGIIYATSPPIMHNNVLFSSGGVAATGFCSPQIGLNGNIAVDPRLAAPAAGDFSLLAGSPAIDAGDPSVPSVPATDFTGAPRVQDGNGDGVAVIDIGAFEAAALMTASVTPIPAVAPPWLIILAALIVIVGASRHRRDSSVRACLRVGKGWQRRRRLTR